jgi:hypothetical protein
VWLGFFIPEKDGLKTTSQTLHQPWQLVLRKKTTIRPDLGNCSMHCSTSCVHAVDRPGYNSVISTTTLFKGAAAPKAFTASQYSVAVIFFSNNLLRLGGGRGGWWFFPLTRAPKI